jgi:ABC-type polar amino acid transport system ATPase subunit
MNETYSTITEEKIDTRSSKEKMIQQAFEMYMHMEARKQSIKAPHKEKTLKARRAKNKAARASRRKNR